MATRIPPRPAPPVPSPVAPAPAATPVAVAPPAAPPARVPQEARRGELTFRLQRLSEPLEMRQVVRDPTYDKFRTWTMFVGIFAFLIAVGLAGYFWGTRDIQQPSALAAPTVTYQPVSQPQPQPASQVQQPTSLADPTAGMSPTERARYNKWVRRQ